MNTFSVCLLIASMCMMPMASISFRDQQQNYPRVCRAYEEKGIWMNKRLAANKLDPTKLRLYIRAFKAEKKVEVWAKNKEDERFQLLITYDICKSAGKTGPKRMQGDFQVPEGYYHIDRFNPKSTFYLSLGINYPNAADQILGKRGHLGGDIFIHGNCVTVGCLPLTDDKIKELYILCVEAKNSGQMTIPVSIFPAMLTEAHANRLSEQYKDDSDKLGLWEDLKKGYDHFQLHKTLPRITFLDDGRHEVL